MAKRRRSASIVCETTNTDCAKPLVERYSRQAPAFVARAAEKTARSRTAHCEIHHSRIGRPPRAAKRQSPHRPQRAPPHKTSNPSHRCIHNTAALHSLRSTILLIFAAVHSKSAPPRLGAIALLQQRLLGLRQPQPTEPLPRARTPRLTRESHPSSAVSANSNNFRSSGEIIPSSARASKLMIFRQ